MKKTSLLVAVPTLALAGLLLSGCGIFRSHKAWNTAKQESPLEIPPGLDRPSTSAALVIPPPGANLPTADGATANVGAASGQIADGFVLADNVDAAYQRVGKVLESGGLGQLVSHDDATHRYTLSVAGVAPAKQAGFFSRLFGHGKRAAADAQAGAAQQVQISINGTGTTSSEVRAEGSAAAVARVIDSLKSSLGN